MHTAVALHLLTPKMVLRTWGTHELKDVDSPHKIHLAAD
jgi:hypothetical protein